VNFIVKAWMNERMVEWDGPQIICKVFCEKVLVMFMQLFNLSAA
jgi:hypothetical protein